MLYELPPLYENTPHKDLTRNVYTQLKKAGLDRTSHGMMHIDATCRSPMGYTDWEKHFVVTGFPADNHYANYVKNDTVLEATRHYIAIEDDIACNGSTRYFQASTMMRPRF